MLTEGLSFCLQNVYRLDGGYASWAASQATREDVPEAPVAILQEVKPSFSFSPRSRSPHYEAAVSFAVGRFSGSLACRLGAAALLEALMLSLVFSLLWMVLRSGRLSG